ncbi:MAG: hypothetical protein CMO20_01985 [Thermoplasmata archaeon]|nr:hypothetical protein [Thermoplasmata archaeon]
MVECIICDEEIETEYVRWCTQCERFAPLLVGAGFEGRPNWEVRAEINTILSDDRGRSSTRRWRVLLEKYQGIDSDWAFRVNSEQNNNKSDPWFVTDEVKERQLEKLCQVCCIRGNNSTDEQIKLLQKGIPLPDGSLLSTVANNWAIDGKKLPGQVPYKHILKSLTGNSVEKKNIEGCNWKLLLTSLQLVANNPCEEILRRLPNRHELRHRYDLMRRNHGPGLQLFQGANLFLNWNFWVENMIVNPEVDPRGVIVGLRQRNQQVKSNNKIDWNLLEDYGPWATRWRSLIDQGAQMALMRIWAGPSIRIKNSRIQLRTIKNGAWMWSNVPPWPKLWALLSSWALSPPSTKEHQLLRAIQWCWNDPFEELIPKEPERRALKLLRQTCDSSDKLSISKSGESVVYVEGTSGLFYQVGSGPGAHNARFTVKGAKSLSQLQQGEGKAICIHEKGHFKKLPLGDVFASVVLTLMDDLTSANKLEPLAGFIHRNGSGGDFLERREAEVIPRWLDHERNRWFLRRDRGRWLNIFPEVYRILINLPIGSVLRLPIVLPNPAIIDNTEVAWLIDTADEGELVRSLARLAGFRDANVGDIEGYNAFERIMVPIDGVRRDLVEMLGPYERRFGRPGEPPWWNLFPNPIAPNRLQEQLPEGLNRPLEDFIINNPPFR